MANPRILIVDDELSMREFLEILLQKEGFFVRSARGGKEAIELLEKDPYDLVICDVKMPRVSGLDVLRKAKEIDPEIVVLMITAYASAETAVEAMKQGAYDYITKPFKVDEIKLILRNALEHKSLVQENILLKKELGTRYGLGNLVGSSEEMLKVYDLIQRAAPTKSNVLVLGESGTGKELVARAIHFNSPRKEKPFVPVSCSAIPETLMESELFGHVKGAFTGAISNKRGLFEMADGGTLFLDEIGEVPLSIQVKLLRVLQEMNFKRVGGTDDISVNVRVIAATNKNLTEAIAEGSFRNDLYYRLNVIQIDLPPLRARREDIPILAEHFLEKHSKALEKDIKRISAEAMELLQKYNYLGNVRELENTIERSVALETTPVILPESLPPAVRDRQGHNALIGKIDLPSEGVDLDDMVGEVEKNLLLKALERAGGVKGKAAELLGISFRSLRYRLAKYGLDTSDSGEANPGQQERK